MSNGVAWFEFLLNPNLLEIHLKQEDADPSAIALIIQFIYNSVRHIESLEAEPLEITTPEATKKKSALLILAMKTAAFLDWDLDEFEQKLPLHMQDALLVGLLHQSIGECIGNPSTHASLDTGPLLPHQLFCLALYHRYAIRAIVRAKLPSKPSKVVGVLIPGQQDPTHEPREVHESILENLERASEISVRILEQLLGAGEVRAPTLAVFGVPSHTNAIVNHTWERSESVADEQFKCQIHYDLGVYHFLQELYDEAFSHFSEALNLLPEIGASPKFCHVSAEHLQAYYDCCANLCGRQTPISQRSAYDRFVFSVKNHYQDAEEILLSDCLTFELPSHLRLNLELDLCRQPELAPPLLPFKVQTLNAIRNAMEGTTWNGNYPLLLGQMGEEGVRYLLQAMASLKPRFELIHVEQTRLFLLVLLSHDPFNMFLATQLQSHPTLGGLLSRDEILEIFPEGQRLKCEAPPPGAGLVGRSGSDATVDIMWTLIYSVDALELGEAVARYSTAPPMRPDCPNRPVQELNSKWELPIPVYNTLMKLPVSIARDLIYLYMVKSQELAAGKSFACAINLLTEGLSLGSKLRDSNKLCTLMSWMMLMTRIQHVLTQFPIVDGSLMNSLTLEAKQCLICDGREGVAPWTSLNNWCILFLLNVGEWDTLQSGTLLPSHLPLLAVARPLTAVACTIRDRVANKAVWTDLWELVTTILSGAASHKRSSAGANVTIDRNQDMGFTSRTGFLEFLQKVRDVTCLSVLVSLMGRVVNVLNEEPATDVHIDHAAMWPSSVAGPMKVEDVQEFLSLALKQATSLYPTPIHASTALCTSWYLTQADLAFMRGQHRQALKGYLTAILVASNFLRSDNEVSVLSQSNGVLRRMVRCCVNLTCFTQAAILCQFLDPIDYSTALGCLQERNCVDAMDAYYDCLWDVTLIEFIVNLHQKRGDLERRNRVLKIMGTLEINANNNEEIQREVAKVRKHRFYRALAKQFL